MRVRVGEICVYVPVRVVPLRPLVWNVQWALRPSEPGAILFVESSSIQTRPLVSKFLLVAAEFENPTAVLDSSPSSSAETVDGPLAGAGNGSSASGRVLGAPGSPTTI